MLKLILRFSPLTFRLIDLNLPSKCGKQIIFWGCGLVCARLPVSSRLNPLPRGGNKIMGHNNNNNGEGIAAAG